MNPVLNQFKQVTTLIFDVDGVLTDGTVLVSEKGDLLRTMNVHDGYAMKKAISEGLRVVVITGGVSEGVVSRLKKLGVKDIYSGCTDKVAAYEELRMIYELQPHEVIYMGDDLPDYNVMQKVGLRACPKDAVPEIKAIAEYVSPVKGGKGCVRELIEKVLKLQGKWM